MDPLNSLQDQKIAVLIPCLNEARTIGKVVSDFQRELPTADVYVFDNGSTDETASIAADQGAIVRKVPRRGKGRTVRAMFRQVSADFYVMVDGDGTYPADAVKDLLAPAISGDADMVVGDRFSSNSYDRENTRPLHGFGNRLIRHLINLQAGATCVDVLSGYRVFSRVFVETIPVLSDGFEIEAEITLRALARDFSIAEIPVEYKERITGSESKLRTFSDGARILKAILLILKNYRPMRIFGIGALLVAALGLLAGSLPIIDYVRSGYVFHVPLAILAASLELMAMLLFIAGLILDTLQSHERERVETDLIRRKRETSFNQAR